MAYLEVRSAGEKPFHHQLVSERTSIGRSLRNDIVLPDLTISRNHAHIYRERDRFVIEDLGSRNGTFVNDRPVSSPVTLSEGAEIRLGKSKAVFFEQEVPADGTIFTFTTTTLGRADTTPTPEVSTSEELGAMIDRRIEAVRRSRILEEFLLAREIQKFLLPRTSLTLPGYRLLGDSQPCYEVGGDFYDYLVLSDGSVGIVIGDVARKGFGAAVLGHYTQAIVRTALVYESTLESLVTKINRDICLHSPPNQFVSAFFCLLDPVSGELEYVNAGHCPPLVVRGDGSTEFLGTFNLLLGIEGDASYVSGRSRVEPGCTLVLYSDGITECLGSDDQPYGQERLARFLSSRPGVSPEQIMRKLEEELEQFAKGSRPGDDTTLVLLHRLPS